MYILTEIPRRARALRSRCRLNRLRRRSFRALSGSFGLTFENSVILRRFLRVFAPAEGRPSSVSRLPGSILESEKRRFSWFFVAWARSVLISCEVYETLHWLTKIEVRASHNRTKKRRKIDTDAVRAYARVRKGLWDASGRRLGRPGLPTWRPRRPTWQPRRPTWRPRRPKLAFGGRFFVVRPRTRSDAERPRAPRGCRNRFFGDFLTFLVDFSSICASIFVRFCYRLSELVRAILTRFSLGFRLSASRFSDASQVPARPDRFGSHLRFHTLQSHPPPSIHIFNRFRKRVRPTEVRTAGGLLPPRPL